MIDIEKNYENINDQSHLNSYEWVLGQWAQISAVLYCISSVFQITFDESLLLYLTVLTIALYVLCLVCKKTKEWINGRKINRSNL